MVYAHGNVLENVLYICQWYSNDMYESYGTKKLSLLTYKYCLF